MQLKLKQIFLIALALLLIAVPAAAQSDGAQLRFVHAIPGASAVDVYVDGQLAVGNLGYGTASTYVGVPAGSHQISVMQAGSASTLWTQDVSTGAGTSFTLIASSASQAVFTVYQDDLNPLTLGKARFTAVHAIAGGAAVDVILADGRPVIPGLQFNQPYGTLDLPVMSYDLAVVPAGGAIGDALVPAQSYSLNSGTSYVLVIYGTADSAQALLLSAPTQPQGDGGYVRIVHGIAGGSAVDAYLNSTLVAPALQIGDATDFIVLPVGGYSLSVNSAGTNNEIATASLDVSAGSYQTVVLNGGAEAPTASVMGDQVSTVNADTSVFTLINATGAATTTAAYADGGALVGDVAAGSSNSAMVEAGKSGIVVSTSADGTNNDVSLNLPGGTFGGLYYSAVAYDGPQGAQVVQLPPVSIARSVGAEVAAVPTEPPTQVPVEAPTAAPPAEQPTAAPSNDVVIMPPATAIPTTEGPTARVLLDPGANLQLRLYPSREAFSLGLAPSGTILQVNGRAGEPVPAFDTTATPLPPNATPFVDPVTLLAEGEDLVPADTWLNVTFDTPDGGTITAWVNALYLNLHNSRNRPLALRDLATIPSNRAGQAVDTAMEPPSPRENVTTAIVTNLDPGVRTHIRRIPSTAGESLALVPAGTQMEFVGVTEARDWDFVRYQAPQSTVTGWISNNYVTLQRNGQSVTFDRLMELGELSILTEDQRGSVVTTGQAQPSVADSLRNVVAGTVFNLNADANLHFRRNDNDQSESLALLPNGTQIIVSGRSPDDTWLQATYDNQQGWVASQYVQLSFNGQPFELASLPVIDTSTPTPSPTPQG